MLIKRVQENGENLVMQIHRRSITLYDRSMKKVGVYSPISTAFTLPIKQLVGHPIINPVRRSNTLKLERLICFNDKWCYIREVGEKVNTSLLHGVILLTVYSIKDTRDADDLRFGR